MSDPMRELADKYGQNDTPLQLPPPIFELMQGEFLNYDAEAKTLSVRFPIKRDYENPMGLMQGGMIATAIDNTVGPLSFLVAPPNVTTHLNVTYLRPLKPEEGHFTVTARVMEQTRSQLFMEADVLKADGKRAAFCQVTCRFMG